ncbi:MAG: GtrA family protein [Rhodoferax sp.]|uniref:GtrA family protein n=1 Tax=Rhodoferax sp. TaxID=50421 RepID=UPI00262250B7|nr:GtrA family protein [Rhodoferax sp.]MDD2881502.1 GtrA family protein [Rhodoferax sp.]
MFFRFLIVGGLGFLIDAGLTYFLVYSGVNPWLARIPSIACAMVFTWLINRQFTYNVKTLRSSDEALRYILVAMVMALINYLIYLWLISINITPVISIIIATAFQTFISFHAYRRFAFKLPVN